MRKLGLLFSVVALFFVSSAAAQGLTVVTGKAGAAYFKVAVPPNWNGDLVVWNHGFSLAPIGPIDNSTPVAGLGPLAELQLMEGYAVIASSYRQTGWALFKSNQDLHALMGAFKSRFGHPRQIFLFGASLGGIVTVQAVEDAKLGNVVGALTVCGAVGGSRNWDGALDLRLVYDAVCAGVPGARLPGDARGLPPGTPYSTTDLALAAHTCTGILAPPAGRTPAQQANLDMILDVASIPENFLLTDLGYSLFGTGDLVYDPTKLHGKLGMGNENVDYGDADLNAAIERVSPNKGAEKKLGKHYTPDGAVGGVKIVSLHTDKDGLVVVENEGEYAARVSPWQFSLGIVVEAVPTHCGFTGAELVSAWESLRGWVAGGPQPTAASLQATCGALAPLFGGPCRIDPTFVVGTLDDRLRPR